MSYRVMEFCMKDTQLGVKDLTADYADNTDKKEIEIRDRELEIRDSK